MAIYSKNNDFLCEKCGGNIFFEKCLFSITFKDNTSTLSKSTIIKKNNIKTELVCNKCGHVMLTPLF